MRLIFLGTGAFGVPALEALVRSGHDVAAAVSQPDRPAGRGLTVAPTPIHAAAERLGVPHIQTQDINALSLQEIAPNAEIAVVAAFGQKLGPSVLGAVPRGCVNIHSSLLPKYRGAAPHQWAILNGDEHAGVTIFQINERWDAGPLLAQRATPIGETETADELHDRLARLGAELIVETLDRLARGVSQALPQDPAQASRAPKLSKADSALDWSQPAARVARRIHGLWSWPAATCVFESHRGKREVLQLARAQVADATAGPTPETPPGAFCADGTVQTGMGRVRLLEVKPAGGKLMPFAAFANGRQVRPPDRLLKNN